MSEFERTMLDRYLTKCGDLREAVRSGEPTTELRLQIVAIEHGLAGYARTTLEIIADQQKERATWGDGALTR